MDFLFSPIPYLVQSPRVFIVLVIIVSAAFGSFFTMLYYRLPIMFQAWKKGEKSKVNLCFPASHCPKCQTQLKPWHNIPLISYLIQGGQCAFCKTRISFQYFLLESLLVVFGLAITLYFKVTWLSVITIISFWGFLALFAIVLSFIRLLKKPDR